jgi:ribosomal protein L11 methyltransferase
VIVVATTDDEIPLVRQRLTVASVDSITLVPAGEARRLVLASVEDDGDRDGERLAAALRREGFIAVARPESGVRLEAWQRETQPITFGRRLTLCFAWSEHDRAGLPNVIELGPGGFGSGHHPTTRLLIEELLARICGDERVLDVGCGSGVLGLAALALGAAEVVAVDVKPEAVAATRRNAALNGMDDRVHATVAPFQEVDGTFDVVLANVGRSAVVELAPQLLRLVRQSGWLAVSGFSPAQCSQVADFLRPLIAGRPRQSGEWAAIVLTY